MEISIKWNICRICLQEERTESPSMKPIFNESRLAKQIVECAGIELSSNDGLPAKICRKCMFTLKYAVSFRNTCRKSDEYLRSVVQKAKEATILDPENEVVLDDLDEVIEDLDYENGEFVYVIADIDEEKMNRSPVSGVSGEAVSDNKSAKTYKTTEASVAKRAKYNLIDLTKGDDITTRNENCYSVEIMPADPLTTISVEDEEEEDVKEITLSEFIKRENKSDESKNLEETGGNNYAFFTDNEVYTGNESQEDGDKSQNEDSNYTYMKLRISNDSDAEYILGEDDLPDSDEILSSDEDATNKKVATTHTKTSGNTSSEKKIFPINATSRVCDHCGNTFSNSQTLRMHIRNLHRERPLECELCSKRFASASNLSAHMRIHTGERRYECKYCHRRFTDRSTHIKHERIHTNEKPFKCETCQKAFALSTSLKAHIRIHTGEKPFECKPCNKAFKLPHQLKAHLSTQLHRQVAMEGCQKDKKLKI